ncbi:MAG: coagulation factor 5/8 type domain protein [Eubacterium sp.]|nr:coagulation factor 5/8 type domain protein [Eubacterium sp.]
MHTYALFDNGTAELVNIKLLNVEMNETLAIYFQSFRSPKVKESARRGIECAYEILFSKDIKAYIQKTPISITVKDFTQQVDGSSAGLAYSVAFASILKKEKIIGTSLELPEEIAATGEVDIIGNVKKIRNLKEKILGAICKNIKLMFYPSQNKEELQILLSRDEEFYITVNNSGIQLKHVASIRQLFFDMGILPNIFIQEEHSILFEHPKNNFSANKHVLSYEIPNIGESRKSKKFTVKNINYIKFVMTLTRIIIVVILFLMVFELSSTSHSVNLAQNKLAFASSDLNSANSSGNALDGKENTGWSSDYSEQQWIYIDLESVKNISHVVLKWEVSYARKFEIQVSTDGSSWEVVSSESHGKGGIDVINFDTVRARYVKMYAYQSSSSYGYSLREFEVYSSD